MSRLSSLLLAISDFLQHVRKGHIALLAFSSLSPTSLSEPCHYATFSVPLERNSSSANHNIGSSFLPTVCKKLNQKNMSQTCPSHLDLHEREAINTSLLWPTTISDISVDVFVLS